MLERIRNHGSLNVEIAYSSVLLMSLLSAPNHDSCTTILNFICNFYTILFAIFINLFSQKNSY